ncbi:Ribosomal RNA large subunit methyltransferase L [Symmachiella dynata]|uniref:Ribosomal RNA large subunit methyltransferase L n=1 Tax=Symmachiella dynata TaxID=2527995 RepID=A0A517ZS16_9PLAN|nr:class I SAM-dependent RNA methyltransferase [Symmachiella dynata]QDU45281.1 Ribosomal RNA large subunit methyltransferase L [Symmachiella dynata]
MTQQLELIATAAFGLEAVVSRELKSLGYADQTVEDGRISFRGDAAAICRCNLWLRSAERVLVKLAEFETTDFGELFDRTKEIPWADWIPADGAFPVRGKSIKSQLHSVPDCQRLVKKAIVEKLKLSHGSAWFEETGPEFAVEVALLRDRATISLDTSGVGLHKRGYRKLTGHAPLRETLSAALIQLSYWNADRHLLDPFCGTGTIPIEAALIGKNIAPGLQREFAADSWPIIDRALWKQAREEANDLARRDQELQIIGTDIDKEALSQARYHARQVGMENDIHFQQKAFADTSSPRKYACLITNPPYGERMGEQEEAEALYRQMATVFATLDTWSIYVLTSHPNFEELVEKKAGRRRKLYNGRIACTYFQYPGPRPPRAKATDKPAEETGDSAGGANE